MLRSKWASRITILLLVMTLVALSLESSGFLQFAGYGWAILLSLTLALNWEREAQD